jgi:hypothetical protein
MASLIRSSFWTGVNNMGHYEFKLRGATEVGFFSVSKKRDDAQAASQHSQLLKQIKHLDDEFDEERIHLALAPDWKRGIAGVSDETTSGVTVAVQKGGSQVREVRLLANDGL